MLKTEYVRSGKYQVIGKKTSGLATGETVARDSPGKILGRSSEFFGTTRDAKGSLTSTNQADVKHVVRMVTGGISIQEDATRAFCDLDSLSLSRVQK